MSFEELGLRVELLKALKDKGFTAPTPIQSKAIPVILEGRDILARAQTGTGKTDAFALPMVETLSHSKGNGNHPRALVLAPTRELALQVSESIKSYARRVSLRCTVVHGGVRVEPQINRLKRGVDILVATPGRLLDLASQRHLNLSFIEFLVFDEADRMLDLGFSREISEVIRLVPENRRTMLFSATYTQQIRDLADEMLKEPALIEVTPQKTAAESVIQRVHFVQRPNKRPLLSHLIITGRWNRVIVFCRTKLGANKLTDKLASEGIVTAALHGNMSQSLRTRTLEEFKNGELRVLVATDVAARGLDIVNLPYVVNYDLPSTPEDYIHRIGRTGRAGVTGIAVSLVCDEDKRHLDGIETLLKQPIPVEAVSGFTQGKDVPDYVMYRPSSTSHGRKIDKDLKEAVDKRAASKRETRERKGKGKVSATGKPQRSSSTSAGAGSSVKGERASAPGKGRKGAGLGKPKHIDTGKKSTHTASKASKDAKRGKSKGRR